MELSLTGSQVGVSPVSSARRSSTNKTRKPPNTGGATPTRRSVSGVTSGRQDKSIKQTPTSSRTSGIKKETKPTSPEDEFMALFESASLSSSGARPKQKPPVEPMGLRGSGVISSGRNASDKSSARRQKQKFSHSIFQPNSARSTSTVDQEDQFQENLTSPRGLYQSGKTLSVENGYLTGENRPKELFSPTASDLNNNSGDRGAGTYRKRTESTGMIERRKSPRGTTADNNNAAQLIGQYGNGTITNNMTTHAMSTGTKTALSDIENSFQNIKHKTPVNQVRQLRPSLNSNQTLAQKQDLIKIQNMSASKIQRWYKKNSRRKRAGEAAMKRLLESKKNEKEEQLRAEGDYLVNASRNIEEENKRRREDIARHARQQAIEELQKKREEKRKENQRIAEQEIKYLQDSGKVTKSSSSKSNLKKKTLRKPGTQNQAQASHRSDSDEEPARNNHRKAEDEPNGINIHQQSPEHHGASANDSLRNVNLNTHSPVQDQAVLASENKRPKSPSHAGTKTTFDDLMETLKQLEQDEKLPSGRKEKNNAQKEKGWTWLNSVSKSDSESEENGAQALTKEKLDKLDDGKDNLRKEGMLSDEKIRSIMSFLDEVETADRLSEIDQDINRINESLGKPALLVPSAEEVAQLEQASAAASEVTQQMISQRLDLEEKKRSVQMLQKALNQQRELTVRHAKETEKEMKKRLDVQKDEYEETIKRHLSFIDQLIDDKKALSEKCETLVKELKTLDKKYSDKVKTLQDNHDIELRKIKDVQAAAEKLRREKWIDEKTKKIKEMTVKGLEPEIQRLIAKHKQEVKKLKSIHEADLLASDERAGQRYIQMTEELRDQLAKEKESACARERELARQTYEKQLRQEEEAYQQQRRRLYSEVQEEKERNAQQASRQRTELDRLQRQLEDSHSKASDLVKTEYEKAREEQERRHQTELRQLKEQLTLEKQAWEENLLKKQETWVMQKERELKEQVRRERDREIELVIQRLEEDNQSSREECERVADNRIKRIRDKYEAELAEVERTERNINEKYNKAKAQLVEVEGENDRSKAVLKQKEKEVTEIKKLLDKLNQERDRVSDVIRQEFADRLVATEEENKRVKNEMSELKARHRIELERCKAEAELVHKAKDEEMEEVHKRVKQAIAKKEEVVHQLKEQFNAAQKRADHLEGLLEQQRKQLLKK